MGTVFGLVAYHGRRARQSAEARATGREMRYAGDMDHGRQNRLVWREGALIHLYPRGDIRRGGVLLAAWSFGLSLVLGAAAMVSSFFSDFVALQLAIGAAIAVCVGSVGVGTWRLASWRITLDPEAKTYTPPADERSTTAGVPGQGKIRLPGVEIAFDSVRAVHLTTARSNDQATAGEHDRFRVDVVLQQEDASDDQRSLMRDITRLSSPPSEQESGEEQAEQIAAVDEMVQRLDAYSVEIARQADALSAWLTAEALARALEVPLFDSCGERALFRLPHELDQPLVERLRQHQAPPHPSAPPPRIQAELGAQGLRARWRVASAATALVATAGLLLCVAWGLGLLVALDTFSLLASGVLLLLVSAMLWFFGGSHGLVVDGEGLQITRPWRRKSTLPLAELEAVRASKLFLPKTQLVSDRALYSFLMPTMVSARWLGRAVEWAVYSVDPKRPPVGPYR